MSKWVEDSLLNWITDKNSERTREHLRAEVRETTAAFAGDRPTRIETTLAETAALSLIALRTFQARFMKAEEKGDLSYVAAQFHLKKIAHAQRRLESSLKTLATVRRLAIPTVQVNVAHNQQVNNQVITGNGFPTEQAL